MKKRVYFIVLILIFLVQNITPVLAVDIAPPTAVTNTITSGGYKKNNEYGQITLDYGWLTTDDKSEFNSKLAEFAAVLANDIYKSTKYKINDQTEDDKTSLLKSYGFTDVIFYKVLPKEDGIDSNDITDVVIGHRFFSAEAKDYEIYIIVVRGTNGTRIEWGSNFDVGCDDEVYYSKTGDHPDWINKNNHKGFDVTANRVNEIIEKYILEYGEQAAEKSFLLTGHSRGAAVANILGAKYEAEGKNSCAYTFSTPNTTKDENAARTTVFNVVCEDDFICYLPLSEWGYKRYGNDISVNVGEDASIQKLSKKISGKNYEYGVCEGMKKIFLDLAEDTYDIYNWDGEGCKYKLSELDLEADKLNELIDKLNYNDFAKIEEIDGEATLRISKAVYCISAAKGIELLGKTGGELEIYTMGLAMNSFFPSDSAVKTAMNKSMDTLETNLEALMNPHRPEVTYSIIKVTYSPEEIETTVEPVKETTEAATEEATETAVKPTEKKKVNSYLKLYIGIGVIILLIVIGTIIDKKSKKA